MTQPPPTPTTHPTHTEAVADAAASSMTGVVMNRIEEIESRLNAATPTAWKCDGFVDGDVIDLGIYEDTDQARVVALGIATREEADLLLNAPVDIAHLLAAVEAVLALHPRAAIAAEEGYAERAYCVPCKAPWPCETVDTIENALGVPE